MRILLSNDDGVYAPGINALYTELSKIATVQVVAPDRDRSAASKSLTLTRPIYPLELANGFTLVEGTPTDCVHYALTCQDFLNKYPLPDMVVAGINNGANLGDDVMYSGTVAAATEGRFLGLPSFAISLAGKARHYKDAAVIAKNIIQQMLNNPLSKEIILNVNIPDLPFEQIKGYKITRLGSRHQSEQMVRMEDPRGKIGYWIGPSGGAQDAGDGTDFDAISQGYVSISPLRMDLTNHKHMNMVEEWAADLSCFALNNPSC
jgi:5'-nucleotidase